ISQTASGSTAVLEYRPTETLPLLGAMLLDFARLGRHCSPARPPKRRKTRVFPATEAKCGEGRTVCWRELDSKLPVLPSLGGLAGVRSLQSGQMRRVASELVSIRCRREVDSPTARPMPSRLSSSLRSGCEASP